MKLLKRYKANIIFRIILIVCNALLFSFVTNPFLITILLFILVFQSVSLINYITKFNNEILRFFVSIKFSDFSQSFTPKNLGTPFDELSSEFNKVFDSFRFTRNEKEESLRYLQTVVQHIKTGLLIYDINGDVILFNNAAKKMLTFSAISNISLLKDNFPALYEKLNNIKHGERTLVKLKIKYDVLPIAVSAAQFRKNDKLFRIVSLFNIKNELEEKELESWQNLIRVLTHEIMNSATPISSLAKSLDDILDKPNMDQETFEDLKYGLKTIQRRSAGLVQFLNNYRSLTKVPLPDFSIVSAKTLIHNVAQLMKPQIDSNNIDFSVFVEPVTMELTIDQKLIEQVLINLLLNAIYAVKDVPNKKIKIRTYYTEMGKAAIEVQDNGTGILEEVQDKIFIPFFTTKQEGSGIGLSLSRQIMNSHNGTIYVNSLPDKGSAFILIF